MHRLRDLLRRGLFLQLEPRSLRWWGEQRSGQERHGHVPERAGTKTPESDADWGHLNGRWRSGGHLAAPNVNQVRCQKMRTSSTGPAQCGRWARELAKDRLGQVSGCIPDLLVQGCRDAHYRGARWGVGAVCQSVNVTGKEAEI